MSKEMDLIKLNTIKRYVKEIKKMRISHTTANELRIRFNSVLKDIITQGTQSAKKDKRTTIMPRDVLEATEINLGKKNLGPKEIIKHIKHLNPIELGELSKAISDYIEKEKKTKNE